MKILAIDTSSSICSVALLENDAPIAELHLDDGKTHSENLMTLINELLIGSSVELKSIDLIACDKGPGSFTGIRIGISSVKAMAEVLGIDVVGVSSLESLAYNEVQFNGLICSLLDARNNQVYCGIFDNNSNKLEDFLADDILNVLSVLNKYDKDMMFVGDGAVLHKNLLLDNLKEKAHFSLSNEQTSINVGKVAYLKFLNNEIDTANTISPLYLRKSQAERMKELKEISVKG